MKLVLTVISFLIFIQLSLQLPTLYSKSTDPSNDRLINKRSLPSNNIHGRPLTVHHVSNPIIDPTETDFSHNRDFRHIYVKRMVPTRLALGKRGPPVRTFQKII
jgi:hypothetical protein